MRNLVARIYDAGTLAMVAVRTRRDQVSRQYREGRVASLRQKVIERRNVSKSTIGAFAKRRTKHQTVIVGPCGLIPCCQVTGVEIGQVALRHCPDNDLGILTPLGCGESMKLVRGCASVIELGKLKH